MVVTIPEALRKMPLFSNLAPQDLARIGGISTLRRYARQDAVFREGDRADGFFLVVPGNVKICKTSRTGRSRSSTSSRRASPSRDRPSSKGGASTRVQRR